MVKKNKKQRGQEDVIFEEFSMLIVATLSSGAASINVSPNSTISARSATVADTYSLYRMKSFRFRLHRASTLSSAQVACYVPGIADIPPSTLSNAAEVLYHVMMMPVYTIPSKWCHVPLSELRGYQPWYKTIVGTPDPAAEILGVLAIAGSGSDTYSLEIAGCFEFKSPIASANTPAMQAAYRLIREERIRLARAEYLKTLRITA